MCAFSVRALLRFFYGAVSEWNIRAKITYALNITFCRILSPKELFSQCTSRPSGHVADTHLHQNNCYAVLHLNFIRETADMLYIAIQRCNALELKNKYILHV